MMKQIPFVCMLILAGLVAGCQTVPKTRQQEETSNLKSVLDSERTSLNACEAELVKYGKYVIRLGDTLSKIAKDNDMRAEELIALNPGLMSRYLKVGQVLNVKERKPKN